MGQLSLSDHSSYLEALGRSIGLSIFRPILNRRLRKTHKFNASRPPIISFDVKLTILQSLYGFSDAQTELQVLNRYTLKRFLEIASKAEIPDEKTIWLFKERLGNEGVKRKRLMFVCET